MQRLSIEVKSFFKPGLKAIQENEGMIILICGKQGTGKSFAAVKLVAERLPERDVYANFAIAPGGERDVWQGSWRDIMEADTSGSVVIIDEVFSSFTKGDRIPHDYTSWLAHCRKNNRIVVLIAQEFLEVPLVLRRFARYIVSCSKVGPLILEHWADGNSLHYDSETSEYVADPYRLRIYKRTRKIGDMYDTLENIAG